MDDGSVVKMVNMVNMEQTKKPMTKTDCLLSVEGITKAFGANEVLKGIDLTLCAGDVLALIGGNGAGKSTLMKIIMGIYHPDGGKVIIRHEEITNFKPSTALSKGIYMIPQEPMLFPNMSVEENIMIGFREKKSVLRKKLLALMKEIGWNIDLSRFAMSLSIAEQQLVEILRGLLRQARILILDEPTSALTFDEVESLFHIIKDLQSKGIGIIYITHRLSEVFSIASHVLIMRDGVITLSGPVSDFSREMLVRSLLPGNAVQGAWKKDDGTVDYEDKKPVFELKDYSGYGFSNINLRVYPGEVLGIAGVVGAGRTELAVTIFGRDKVLGGKAYLDGVDVTGLPTEEILKAGINYVPEDRRLNGLFGISDIAENTTSALIRDLCMGRFFLNKKAEEGITGKYVEDFHIRITGQNQLAGSLSGGNQQKIVIGRALATKPKLIILDEPTRGIDAAVRGDVYTIIQELKKSGVAILLISSDMEEIEELSDRAIVVYQGRIMNELDRSAITQERLMSASFGLREGR